VTSNRDEANRHIAALDGLRAVAIFLVILRHSVEVIVWPQTRAAGLIQRAMLTGWIGVDIFFVLSGFLITGILVDARGDGTRAPAGYFRAFYARRALRIFPLYYLFLVGAFIVQRVPAPYGTWWYWTYLTNELFARHGFQRQPHLWSLAVEEQFYLVWPAMIRLVPRRRLVMVAWAMVVASTVLRVVVATRLAWPGAYVLTSCRLDEFAVGGLLALQWRSTGVTAALRRNARVALVAGVIVVFACGLFPFPIRPRSFEGGVFVAEICTAAAIALTLYPDQRGALSHLLGLAPLRSIGRYSYAMYLVHVHVITLVHEQVARVYAVPSLATAASQVIATLAISWAIGWFSWRILERPLLSLKRFVPMPTPRRDATVVDTTPADAAAPAHG